MFAIVDESDAPSVLNHLWTVGWSGKGVHKIYYAERRIKVSEQCFQWYKFDRKIRLHHFLLGSKNQVDHKNGNGLDNRRCNLRHATAGQNNANKRLPSNSTTGFKGVFFRHVRGANKTPAWRALIGNGNGVSKKHLGYFSNPIDAAKAYNSAALKKWGDFAKLNIIPQQTNETKT